MNRRVLLLEPNYRNKYPPVGLMKLAMYHRLQGDEVVFYKGDLPRFVLSEVTNDAIVKFNELDSEFDWRKLSPQISNFIYTGSLKTDSGVERAAERPFILKWLKHYRNYFRTGQYYKNPRWDRVCVTTLFTFHWNITIQTIEFAKKIINNEMELLVGGILASTVPDAVEKSTGIRPYCGIIQENKLLNDNPVDRPIDELPLDYSILDEIDYQYPANDAYYANTTRGCVNKCSFCAVPIIEQNYTPYIQLQGKINDIKARVGEQRHLLLMDNNVFASDKFDIIVDDIYASGFGKDATFIPPNHLDFAVRLLESGWNDRAAIRKIVRLLNHYSERLNGEQHDRVYALLLASGLTHEYTATKDKILTVYGELKSDYERFRSKKPVRRSVDFNQGVDARLATEDKIKKLATVAIRPLRVAFDSWSLRRDYVRAIELSARYGIKELSNYLLYNFKDHPVDLYRRLLLNIDLCDALDVNIYSFPMKYHPITDEKWFTNRDFCGKHWSRKSIRTIQAVLNSTKGKIGRGRTFFFKAFGRTEDEFLDMVNMPESFIIMRLDAELSGLTEKWRKAFGKLNNTERDFVEKIISTQDFTVNKMSQYPTAVQNVLKFYLIKRENISLVSPDAKASYIKEFESTCPTEISCECRELLTSCRHRV
jgi:hypothetical protein